MAQNKENRNRSIHAEHRKRVKGEFLARGIEGWKDHKVLELLLFYALPQGDVNPLAHDLIERFGSLAGVLDAAPEELKKVDGVGDHTVTLLKLLPAVGGRYIQRRSEMGTLVRTVKDAAQVLRPKFRGACHEMVYILCLDGKQKLLGMRKVAEGSIQSADISIRLIAELALALRSDGIYLAHNHVSNLAFPSGADWMSLDVLEQAMSGIGIKVYDHLIFSDEDVVSLRETERGGKRPVYELYY